jgi:hypothetical protein
VRGESCQTQFAQGVKDSKGDRRFKRNFSRYLLLRGLKFSEMTATKATTDSKISTRIDVRFARLAARIASTTFALKLALPTGNFFVLVFSGFFLRFFC